ncbi:anthranilate synthase component I [Ostreibacterium oceani]|uniref:Anthranilate synthase component 1 n=1 Tax=Ostreibacterium oceani TaxID=2654998 RepID=A0A6N7EV39_9GAMM|nr:anthranilate synthase component I [Ostreibacterium oceani]MPV86322.1 anthranilate synthase component I [Ostreibacterium oceani]
MEYSNFSTYVEQGYNRIPVFTSVLCDLDTALTLYLKVANAPYSYLFESVQGGEQWARYSMIGLPSPHRIEIRGQQIHEIDDHQITNTLTCDDPLAYIDEVTARYRVPEHVPGLPEFMGGLVGYFAYDVIRLIEPALANADQVDELNIPDVVLIRSESVIVIDNLLGKAYLITLAEPNASSYQAAQARLNTLLASIKQPLPASSTTLSTQPPQNPPALHYSTPKPVFLENVAKAKQYIVDGDAFQIVLSQRMTLDFDESPLDLYRVLRTLNPSPYMYYLNLDEFTIVGASPEILVRFENRQAQVRPIAGTRKRGKTHEADLQLEKDLLNDPKELAEHLMLIDLGRNDIGRIAKPGKVNVDEKMAIERYSHVMHIVSNVIGDVLDDKSTMDVFKSVFPAGTLSGAPKIRAMQIIDELEPVKRNIYGGAIGYIAWNGNMDTAITIRTAIIKDKKLMVQAGAGIVYDSDPESEWEETLNKAASIITACQLIHRV